MKPRRLLTMIVLAIATLAVAAHVCVVPHAHALDLHPHAWDAAVTANAPSEHSDQPKDDDAIHDASCTGLRSQQTAPTPVITATAAVVVDFPRRLGPAIAPALRAPASNPPPLFLLHASLLI